MFENLKKPHSLIAILLALILLTSIILFPNFVQIVGLFVLVISISMAIMLILQKHWKAYQQAECTREKMMRNLAFDIISLLLTMSAAMSVGRLAGGYFGLRTGFWFGMLAGFLGGFVAAWMVRAVLGRLIVTA